MEAIYVLRIKVADHYDGSVLDEGQVMVSALNIINSGDEEIPVLGVRCERVDEAPVKANQTDGAILERVRGLQSEGSGEQGVSPMSDYETGWQDALRAALDEDDQ